MKQINEIKRMQKLAGVLNENINEAKSAFYKLGFQAGPNGRNQLDSSSKEGQYIANKIKQISTLLNDEFLIDFAKGYVNSVGSSQYRYEGLETVAKVLLDTSE